MERKLYSAVSNGDVSAVKEILRNNPTVDVNWSHPDDKRFTFLHRARGGDHSSIVAILLAHPGINVNLKNSYGGTSFWYACYAGQGEEAVSPSARFFAIANKLPLELQMVMCFRLVGSDREVIPSQLCERAFKQLAQTLL